MRTFHFNYPNLDIKKIEDSNKIDVLSENKKAEVTELVNYIKKFKPTKIAIEAFPKWKATEKLQKYKEGGFRNERDERFQIAMRIATDLKLDTLYSIDAGSLESDLMKVDSAFVRKLNKDYDFNSTDPYNAKFLSLVEYEESLPSKMNLLKYFKRMNSDISLKLGYGGYLMGDFKLDNQRGADKLSIWWYNRNLRIFRKIQEITESSKDRILVLFGSGHAAILKQLLESSPEYEFVKFGNLK